MRKITQKLMFALLLLMAGLGYSQKVAVIGINHTGSDGFTFVVTNDLASGETIYFTENEYNPTTNAFGDVIESVVSFTASSVIAKGNVVFVSETATPNTYTVTCTSGSCGTATHVPGTGPFALATDGEALYAYSDSNNVATDGLTTIHSVMYTGLTEPTVSNGGPIPAGIDPSGDFPTAIVVDGFPGTPVQPDRVEFTPTTPARTNVNRLMLENPSNYVHAQPTGALSTIFFTNLNLVSSNPVLTVAATPSVVNENSGTGMVYTFTLSTNAPSNITVNFTVGGTAVFGTDYTQTGAASFTATTGTITIPSGSNTASMTLTPTGETTLEPHENIVITISAGTGYDAGSPGAASTTINNDDTTNNEPLFALVGSSHADPDGFSFVAVKDIPAGTVVYFTDNSFNNNTLLFGSGEAVVRWTSPGTTFTKGNVVVVTETAPDVLSVTCSGGSCGTIALISGNFALATTGETLYAYADNDTNPSNGVTEVYAVLFTGTSITPGGNIPAVEDPSSIYLKALVVDGFPGSPDPARTEYNPAGRNILVTEAIFENPSNWVFAQTPPALSTTPFANLNLLDSTPPAAVCQNISVTPNVGTGTVTITASQVDGGSTDNVGIASLSVSPNTFTCANIGTPVTVTLTVTDTSNNVSTCTATVTVLPNAVATFTQVNPICSGGSFTLPTTSNNGTTGTWAPAINNTATTTYTFTPNAGQCASSTTMTVVVNPNVTPTFTQVAPICSGGSFSLPTTSNNGVTGTWAPAIDNTATTTYTFTPGIGQCGTTATMTVVVNPNVTPTFTAVAPICSGASLSALPTVSNNGISGTWSPALDNTATTTYTFTPDAGQCATTATLTITVNVTPPPTSPDLTVTFTGQCGFLSGTYAYEGLLNGKASYGLTSDPTLKVSFDGTKWVLWCCSNIASTGFINTNVPAGLYPPLTGWTVTQCNNGTMDISPNSNFTLCTGATIADIPLTGTSLQWYDAATNGNSLPTSTVLTSGSYYVTQTQNGCESSRGEVVVTINPNVTPTFTQVGPICLGETLSALPTTSLNGITGTWAPALDASTTTTYTFTPTAGQCATTANMTIVVNPNVTPSFTQVSPICSGGSFSLAATSNNGITGTWSPAIDNTATTTYTFTPDAGQCATTATMTVVVNPNITPSFTQVAPICAGGSFSLPTTSTNSITGTWAPAVDNTATTTYTFTPDAGQCAVTATMTVVVNPLPTTPIVTSNSPVCEGGTLNLSVTNAASGYTMNPNSGVAFIDINATGTQITGLADDSEHNITIPAFTFNGITYTNARLGMNGVVVFGSTTGDITFTNAALPTSNVAAGNIFIAPFWEDLDIQTVAKVATQTVGNKFIIQYTTAAHDQFTIGSVTFQAQLDLVTGEITYVYQDVIFGSPAFDSGASTTVGIQFSSSSAIQYSFNTASLVNGQSITFSPLTSYTYSWTGPNGFTSALMNPSIANVTAAANGTYSLVVTDNTTNCSSAAGTVNVVVNPNVIPTFDPIPPVGPCAASPLPTTSTNGITGTWSPAFNPLATATYTFTPNAGQCASTTTLAVTVIAPPGDPSVFGTNVWNVYAWNSGGTQDTGTSWNTNYSGYYTIPTVSFDTTNQWCDGCAPSDAAGYIGCPVSSDNHSWSAKRQGFPAGNYSIDIPSHDDEAELYINGVMVWEHVGCCDFHGNVWQGALGANDTVEYRVTEGGGGSHGMITFNLIEPGASLNFDSTSNVVSLGQTLGNFGTGDFSIEMKIKTAQANGYLLSKRSFCDADNFISLQLSNGVVNLETVNFTIAGNGVNGTTVISDNNWHQIAVTRTAGVLRVYVDGNLDGTGNPTPGNENVNLNNAYTLQLGGVAPCTFANPLFNPYQGNMDEVRFWSRALCQTEIQNNMNCEVQAAPGIGLLANYHFNQGLTFTDNSAVTTLIDSSGNGNDGTLSDFELNGTTSNWSADAAVVSGVACAPFALTTYYADADNDGYGNPSVTVLGCQAPAGYVATGTDCDDTLNSVHPGAVDVCGDGLDNDCNGIVDNVGQIGGCNPGLASLTGTYCGATLSNSNVTLVANYIQGAQGYRFRVRNAATNAVVGIVDRPVNSFALSNMPGITLSTTYLVDVALRVGNVWQAFYGQPCTVTTPTPVATIGAYCGTTLSSMSQWIVATYQPSVTAYRFRLTNNTTNAVYVYDALNGLNKFNFNQLPASFRSAGTVYTVEVALRNTDGNYLPYGAPCNVTTPGITKMVTPSVVEFKALAYPNPFAENFMFDVKTGSESTIQLRVYDMLGKQIENRNIEANEINNIQFGDRYPSGVYNVILSQENDTQTLRVIKR